MIWIILILSVNIFAQNPYLDEFNDLPNSYKRIDVPLIDNGEHLLGDEFLNTRQELVNKYSWAVPTDEAIDAIVKFSEWNGLIDFGAGSGYWSMLVAKKGINVIAVDNWTADKPELWFDVQTGSYEYLKMAGGRVLFMCWIPQYTDMGLMALKTWNGDKFIMVGEPAPARSNANPEFFEYLEANYSLVKMVDIPNWFNHNDEVFFYERIK